MKRRHHYVPRFYLKAFATDASAEEPKQIALFNLERGRLIPRASLRDQCYAHKLYGKDDRLEDALSGVEGPAAETIACIRANRVGPANGSADHVILRTFIALQKSRTEGAIAQVAANMKAMDRAIFDGRKRPDGWQAMDDEGHMLLSMSGAVVVADAMADLQFLVVEAAPGTAFITSDSPVFVYNQYCEGLPHFGVTGAANAGFQAFFPIAPDMLLLAYDASVYKMGSRGVVRVTASVADMTALNRIQFVTAHQNVYFPDAGFAPQCAPLLKSALKGRAAIRPRINIAVPDGEDGERARRSELLHFFVPMPQLDLRLSFASIRREARRVEKFERARTKRRGAKVPEQRAPMPDEDLPRRFVVKRRI